MRLLVTGASGFIGGYLVARLLAAGHDVVGVDDFSKYGKVPRPHDAHPRYRLVEGDCKNAALLRELAADREQLVAGAAMVGGIDYFHALPYDLLVENERITAATFDAALWAFHNRGLRKIVVLSSSMVYDRADEFPSAEGLELRIPPPRSTYGLQKLACEYHARAAREQHGLPFTIARPFNCVGIGELRALAAREVSSGDLRLAMSHVVPDLVRKLVQGQSPLRVLGSGEQVRHYTYGGDIARGIQACIEHPAAVDEDFNLATPHGHTVREVAARIWSRLRPGEPFRVTSDPAYPHDVQRRVPSIEKARALLGFEAATSLDQILDEVVPWVVEQVRRGAV